MDEFAGRWRFAVDRGGTFTDVVGIDPRGRVRTAKLLSHDPAYDDAAVAGIRRLLEAPPGVLPAERVAWIRLGTTVATNALLERKGVATGLLITRGFRDLLEIGDQRRPDLFALAIRKPELLYTAVAEAGERMGPDGIPLMVPEAGEVRQALISLRQAGCQAVAIVFLHAWRNPAHERMAAALARELGFLQVTPSHQAMAVIQVVGRGRTALVDAYLTPVLLRYAEQVRRWTGAIPLHFMSSSGSLLAPGHFTGKDAILSGPAGGVLGVAAVAGMTGDAQVIGFDMGGTSTDVCRYAGTLERVLEVETAGIRYHAPMLRVETVAAGGGSLLGYAGGTLTVGPESAGAEPGPACYGRGGPAALTDANLLLGRLLPEHFPRLFGVSGRDPLDTRAAHAALAELARRAGEGITPEALALGCVEIANEAMARPIKALSVAMGHDLAQHALVCFGGAGGQHACGIARSLGIRVVRLHPLDGVLSALGIALTPRRLGRVVTLLVAADQAGLALARERGEAVAMELTGQLRESFGPGLKLEHTLQLDLRTPGADATLTVAWSPDAAVVRAGFQEAHQRHYGFAPPPLTPELMNIRVEVAEAAGWRLPERATTTGEPRALGEAPVWFTGTAPTPTPVHHRDHLPPGWQAPGPLLLIGGHATVVVEPGFRVVVEKQGILSLYREETGVPAASLAPLPVRLELFNHRFMGIATRMGETLARTAHSVNIKERLDFSCAIFDASGRLVANAPHVPVHLGAMGETVRALLAARGDDLRPGDVHVCNDPHQGGSHLPDVTAVSPVFRGGRLVFLVASRGHHADIGGITPGSMPPHAERLEQEGVVLSHLLVVREGRFLEPEVIAALSQGPWPARNLPERLSDLRAQMAANQRGVTELQELCDAHGEAALIDIMARMREQAARAVEEALEQLLAGREMWQGAFRDALDSGEAMAVAVRVFRNHAGRARAVVDFTGTAPAMAGNLNAPPAVTRAAVLYLFRALIHQPIPLNDGCLDPITLIIPAGSLLAPGPGAAVAGGNVETSQRVVDLLCGALHVAAASQGTMNNFSWGPADGSGTPYYETIAGGAGAVPGFAGASGVQVHMTNTRITDVEVLETRFPAVRVEGFSLRRGSGGAGTWPGGEGVVRTIRFLAPMAVTILSERRVLRPFGLAGGEPGMPGENWLLRENGERVALPGRFHGVVVAGEGIEIGTPGGGGWGEVCFRHPW